MFGDVDFIPSHSFRGSVPVEEQLEAMGRAVRTINGQKPALPVREYLDEWETYDAGQGWQNPTHRAEQ